MEDSNYFVKAVGLESYIGHEKNFCGSPSRVDMNNLDYNQMEESVQSDKDGICDKQDVINDDVTTNIEADDFFSSLELQSSSKNSSTMLSLNFPSKLWGGVVTRSRIFSWMVQEPGKANGKLQSKPKTKRKVKKNVKRRKSERLMNGRKARKKVKSKKRQKSPERKDKSLAVSERKKQNQNRLDESVVEKGLGFDKSKDDSDWVLFNQLGSRKEMDDKLFEGKHILSNDLQNPIKRMTPELFSMSPILMSDAMSEGRDEVDKLLEVDDYDDDPFLEMDEFNYAPPRSHTGGKWKPGSLSIRTSPMLWQNQTWDTLLDDRNHYEDGKSRAETPIESFTENGDRMKDSKFSSIIPSGGKSKPSVPPASHTGGKWKPVTPPATHTSGKWKPSAPPASHTGGKWKPVTPPATQTGGKWKPSAPSAPPASHTGGKWKPAAPPANHTSGKWKPSAPSAPPASHTGGKWKPSAPPATHTGGKWKPSEIPQRSKKSEHDLLSVDDGDNNSECYSRQRVEPPSTHTGGKWKPTSSLNHAIETEETISRKSKDASVSRKSSSDSRSALDVLTNQSTSGKNFRCTKTSGGTVQYHCLPCNRRLSSKQMYKSHIQTDLHCRRVLQESDLEYDSRVVKLYQQNKNREREPGKRIIKKPDLYKDTDTISKKETESLPTIRMRGKRVSKRELIRCDVCKIKLPTHQLGKHLVSYYHSRRMKPNDPDQQELILNNIHSIVKQAPYQCGMCKFYCNTHELFKKHWALPVHEELEQSQDQKRKFWCAFCSYECETAKSMELHLDSNSHREVIWAVNKSMPIIIRHKVIFTCKVCCKEFRFKRECLQHQQRYHHLKMEDHRKERYICSICQYVGKSLKSFQVHVVCAHKNDVKIPYFCRICDEHFSTAVEAKIHRNGQFHKYKRSLAKKGDTPVKGLSRTCVYCLDTLENIEKLKSHFVEKHPEHRPRCIKCGKIFALSQEVSRHVKNNECHFPESPNDPPEVLASDLLSCDLCAFTTMYKSEMLVHEAIHKKKDDSKKIECPLCKSQFIQSALRIHLRGHLNEMMFNCSICLRGFVRKDRYVKHLKKKHFIDKTVDPFQGDSSDDEEKDPDGELNGEDGEGKQDNWIKKKKKRRKCGDPRCRYEMKDNEDSEFHRRVHVAPKVFKCTECNYTTTCGTVLKRHFVFHLESRSYPCPHCSFKAKLKPHLTRHLKVHSYAKPFKCPYCPHTCNILENLRKHVLRTKQHAGKKLFRCKMCSFESNVSKEFLTHYADNHQGETKDPIEAYIAAGLYNREEESLCTPKGIRSSKAPQPSRKTKSCITEKDLLSYTKKFCAIAPKLPSTKENEKESPPKPYPSPAEEDLQENVAETIEREEGQVKVCTRGVQTELDYDSAVESEGNLITLSDVPPSNVARTKVAVAQAKDTDNSQTETSSQYVLCEMSTINPTIEMEFYVLQDCQVVANQGLMYLI